ncbi:DUF819 family protein [Pukyongiella litopenaei]|uniref:DUF819 family protein n=1 Tax=Pukyongiella litopenaei TaxID=2605946 RepID=A0A2S0MQX3_9RHOB|nr:DUF819 family protein [Pukyongiella litopenaei]AVO38289.1 DUF819 family protein [Pukyongiella litopenaei]
MLFAVLMFVLPAILIGLCQRIDVLDRIGVVILTFALGMFIAALFSGTALFQNDAFRSLQTTVSEVSVALALPLIIFSTSLRTALRDSGGALKAMGLALVSVCLASFAAAFFFAGSVDLVWQVAGMATGAYTGSGVNLAAVKTAIGADQDTFLTMVTYDIVYSAFFMLVVMVFGQRLAGLVLRPYVFSGASDVASASGIEHIASESASGYLCLIQRRYMAGSLVVLAASAIVVVISLVISGLFPAGWSSTATILSITTLGMIGSLLPALHRRRTGFHLGMYLILVFCLTSGTMLDTAVLTDMNWALGGYFASILIGTMVVLLLLCRLADIDRDTYLVAACASIMSVPFIPVIAGALKNRELLIPGIAIAVIGYAVGNYLGVLVATLVRTATGT